MIRKHISVYPLLAVALIFSGGLLHAHTSAAPASDVLERLLPRLAPRFALALARRQKSLKPKVVH